MYTNARSVFNKIDDLQQMGTDYNVDIILVTESWCNKNITNAMLNIPGFFLEEELRLDGIDTLNGIGGGLLVYIKQGLKINLLPLIDNDFCQYVRFQVGGTNSDQKIIFYLIYRSPNSNLANNKKLLDLIPVNGRVPSRLSNK